MKKIGALLASLFLLASCGAKENVTQKDKNEVVIRISQDPDFLDPSKAVSAGTDEILFNIYEGLMKIQSNGELKPAIAEKYNISNDGKTYTFIIRKNIKLSNGDILTPEMIKEAYLKVMEKDFSGNSKAKAIKDNIDKITVDGDKLIFTLKIPSKLQLPIFTFEISKKIDGTLYGTGPFKIDSYSPGENIIVKKNRYYWEKTSGNLDVVEFKIIKDTQSAIMSMQMGEVDLIAKLEPQYLDLINQKDFTIVKGEQNLVQQLSINNSKSPLNNLKVREAIAYAINKNDIINGVSMGEAKACGSGVSPIVKAYYNPETENIFKYNIEKSKELLKEAGYENGLNLNLKVASNYGFNVDTAQVIKEELGKAGINVQLDEVEWGSWLENVYSNRNYDLTVIGLDGKIDPYQTLERYISNNKRNFQNFNNKEFDSVMNEIKLETNQNKLKELYKKAQYILTKNVASVFIQAPNYIVVMNKKLSGYVIYPVYVQDLSVIKINNK